MDGNLVAVGFDDGFAESKVAWRDGSGEIKTLSFATAAQNGAMFADVITSGDGRNANSVGVYTCDGETITVTPTHDGESLRHEGYHTSLSNRAVLQHALQAIGLGGKRVFVTAGLPVGQFYLTGSVNQSYIDKKCANMIGDCGVADVRCVAAKVEYGQVLSQAVAAYVDQLVSDEGTTDHSIGEERIGIVDIGGSTTDCVVLQAGRVLLESATTHRVGTLDLLPFLDAAIRPIVDVRVPRFKLAAAMREKSIKVFGNEIDLNEVIASAVAQKTHAVMDAVNRSFSGGDRVDRVIVVGGGASLFVDAIAARYRGAVTLVQKPAFANARGMLKQAEAALESLQVERENTSSVKQAKKSQNAQLRAV